MKFSGDEAKMKYMCEFKCIVYSCEKNIN